MTIGDKEVVGFVSMIVPNNEEANFTVHIIDWELNITLVFVVDDGEQHIEMTPLDTNHLKMIFKNFTNSLGTTLKDIGEIGIVNNRKLYYLPITYSVGNMNRIDIQFLLEQKK